jgi:hypothetical protein
LSKVVGFYKKNGKTRPITRTVNRRISAGSPLTVKKEPELTLNRVRDQLKKEMRGFGVQRLEGNLLGDDMSWHKFNTLEEADRYIQEQSFTAPDQGNGYDKFRVDLLYRFNVQSDNYPHGTRTIRIDVNKGAPNDMIERAVYNFEKFRKEHPREYFDHPGTSIDYPAGEAEHVPDSYSKHTKEYSDYPIGGGDNVRVYKPINPIQEIVGGKVKFIHKGR